MRLLFNSELLVLLAVITAQAKFETNAFSIANEVNAYQESSSTVVGKKISPIIVHELKDFIKLIPRAELDKIVAEHFAFDSHFRKAVTFIKSKAFTQLVDEAIQITEIAQVLEFVHLLVDATETYPESFEEFATETVSTNYRLKLAEIDVLNDVEPSIDFILIDTSSPILRFGYKVRTLTTVIQQILNLIPRKDFVELINKKQKNCAEFAQFYTALHSSSFKPMVETVMKSKNAAGIIKSLNDEQIDVASLVPIMFEVISWGPSV